MDPLKFSFEKDGKIHLECPIQLLKDTGGLKVKFSPKGGIEVQFLPTTKMLIKVKTLTGKIIEIYIEPTYTIYRIKEIIQEKEGIPIDHQRLHFASTHLSDDKTAQEYKIQDGSVLHLVLRC